MSKKLIQTTLFFLSLFILIGCEQPADEETTTITGYPNSHLLTEASDLSELIAGLDIFLIDAREEVGDSLIPGAVHFAARSELVDNDHPIENYLIGPDEFQQKMRNIGLNNNQRIVIYDDGNNLSAARLFYALDYYGFSGASLLNGGIQAWNDQNLEVASAPAQPESGDFIVDIREGLMCDFEYISEAANSEDKVIFDARTAEEYSGETVRAERGGHIPNAVHFEWSNALESEGIPYFLPAESLRSALASAGITPDKEVIPHCQSNVRGSHAYFTLRLMGFDSVRPYEGSWAEYGNREDAVIQQ